MIDFNFVPETLEWCRKHYVPPIKHWINCPDFGNCDGTNGVCWHCMEMTPYQHEMCHDEWEVRSYMSPFNKYHVDTREEAAELIEKDKQEYPRKNIIEYLYHIHKAHQEEMEMLKVACDLSCYVCEPIIEYKMAKETKNETRNP